MQQWIIKPSTYLDYDRYWEKRVIYILMSHEEKDYNAQEKLQKTGQKHTKKVNRVMYEMVDLQVNFIFKISTHSFSHLLSKYNVPGTGMRGKQQLQSTRIKTHSELGTRRNTTRFKSSKEEAPTLPRRPENAFQGGLNLPSEGQWARYSSRAQHELQQEVLDTCGAQ